MSRLATAIILALGAARIAMGLDAGVATAGITPDVKAYRVPLAGYGARLGMPATGVHDPLHAKALVLRDKSIQLALITCDLRSITPELKGQVVAKAADKGFTLDNVFMCASHTHDGPAMYPETFWQMQFGKYDPRIVDIMSSAIAAALREAYEKVAPARIGFGEGNAEGFAGNRRWDDDLDARKAAGETPVISSRVWVMRVDGMDGKPRAVFVNFAAHPTILGAKNMQVSAEWPGVLQAQLEQAFPGAVALFSNGGEGDQSPSGAKGADDFEKIRDYGSRLAKVVEPIMAGVQTQADISIAVKRATPDLPELTYPEGAKKRFAAYLDAAKTELPRKAEIQIVRIGGCALAGLPGEPILEVAQAVEKSVGEKTHLKTIAIGLANDYIGYLVNEKEYAHGGYEVDSRSYYGPGLGRFLAEQAARIASEFPTQ